MSVTIQWFGLNHVRVQGKDTSVIFDPLMPESGLKVPKQTADIITFSSVQVSNENTDAFLIQKSGEFEVKGVFIFGFETKGQNGSPNYIYMAEIDDMYITHLGNLKEEDIPEHVMERIMKTDILCIPVGGNDVLNAKQAENIFSNIEPGYIIPIHYKTPGLKAELQDISHFCKEAGITQNGSIDKLKVSKKDLAEKASEVVILSMS